ncbi:hypothetical protein chiPu_0028419, partial [Chiloscyllium punctatum]|nr:hypothetical protein [Chiloscyllium punctatum]
RGEGRGSSGRSSTGSVALVSQSRPTLTTPSPIPPSALPPCSKEVFREERGARLDARWVMIVITDGESNDRTVTFREAIASADQKNIVRYAIGVGEAFDSELAVQELKVIASSPAQDYVFKVGNFTALSGLQSKLQQNIFAIE